MQNSLTEIFLTNEQNKSEYDSSLNEPKVADRNKYLLFWSPALRPIVIPFYSILLSDSVCPQTVREGCVGVSALGR